MGLRYEYLKYIYDNINNTLGKIQGKYMLELGNQHIMDNSISEKTGKEYFKNLGLKHISVDINGLDGALPLDLRKPEQFIKWHNYFDIITNAGTTEHIEPKNFQYDCFSIVHNCLKLKGIAIHFLPDINELNKKGCWKGHCFNYYSYDFFKILSERNNYKLVSLKTINGLICACLQKKKDIPFMEDRDEFLNHIIRIE